MYFVVSQPDPGIHAGYIQDTSGYIRIQFKGKVPKVPGVAFGADTDTAAQTRREVPTWYGLGGARTGAKAMTAEDLTGKGPVTGMMDRRLCVWPRGPREL